MALITDINTAGASGFVITVRGGLMQIALVGTWNGGTVALQKRLSDDSFETVKEWTADAWPIIETVGSGTYQFFTTQGGSAPVLKCDVTFASSQAGRVEAP